MRSTPRSPRLAEARAFRPLLLLLLELGERAPFATVSTFASPMLTESCFLIFFVVPLSRLVTYGDLIYDLVPARQMTESVVVDFFSQRFLTRCCTTGSGTSGFLPYFFSSYAIPFSSSSKPAGAAVASRTMWPLLSLYPCALLFLFGRVSYYRR